VGLWKSESRGAWFGAHKSARSSAVRREVDGFLEPFDVLPFDRKAAGTHARVRFDLERIGRPICEREPADRIDRAGAKPNGRHSQPK